MKIFFAIIFGAWIVCNTLYGQTTCPAPLPGAPNCFQTSRPNQGNPLANWPPIRNQDCCNAIYLVNPLNFIDNGVLVPVNAPSGFLYPGCVQDELPNPANTCFSNNEKATTWYKFQIRPLPNGSIQHGAPAGKLRFKIIPLDCLDDPNYDPFSDIGAVSYGNTDYDFLLFKMPEQNVGENAANCASIKNSTGFGGFNSVIASCNWTGTRGPTGLFEPGTGTASAQGPSTRFNKPLNVFVGDVFYLAIDNFSVNQQGFYVDFRGLEAPDDSTALVYGPGKWVKGTVFSNQNGDCIQDEGEIGIKNVIVQNGNDYGYFGMTDNKGNFSVGTEGLIDTTKLKIRLPGYLQPIGSFACPPNGIQNVLATEFVNDTARGKNFSVNIPNCPLLRVSLGLGGNRVCVRNQINMMVSNVGGQPSSPETNVVLKLPKYLHFISSEAPYTFQSTDSTYIFPIGVLPPFSQKAINIIDSVACITSLTGFVQCVKAEVFPQNNCLPNPPGWDGVDLAISASCNNTNPMFTLKNKGLAMASAKTYRLFFNGSLVYTHSFQLGQMDSIMIEVPVIGNPMVRMEADQSLHHPYSLAASAQISCSGPAFAPNMPFATNTGTPVVDEVCEPIRNSFDPNDKRVNPKGVGPQGFIPKNTPMDYTIRFVNKGNDVAYKIIIVDQIDENLNLSTLQPLASSHPYQLQFTDSHRQELKFVFNNINLPDSASNPSQSHGYVRFRIFPKPDLALGTEIKNGAAIYFDFNPPIFTNTVLNTLYLPPLVPGLLDSVTVISQVAPKGFSKNRVEIFPNPSLGQFQVQTDQLASVKIFSIEGRLIWQSAEMASSHLVQLSKQARGFYFVHVETPLGRSVQKIQIH